MIEIRSPSHGSILKLGTILPTEHPNAAV